jgi:hypothetical protein
MGIELSRHSMKEHSVGFGLYTSLVNFRHIRKLTPDQLKSQSNSKDS